MGAWIEIYETPTFTKLSSPSLPSWERGLKYLGKHFKNTGNTVAPLVGAWIEIVTNLLSLPENDVAPLVGAWIEIFVVSIRFWVACVAPLVGAWIEIVRIVKDRYWLPVAPLVGAWIEIQHSADVPPPPHRRSPRGSVD